MKKCCDYSLVARLSKTIALLKLHFPHFSNSNVNEIVNMESAWHKSCYLARQTI